MRTSARRIVRLFSFVATAILICFLVSCGADMGVFNEDEKNGYKDYYEALGDVVGKYDNNKEVADLSYDVEKSLFNDTTVNQLKWANDDDKVEYKEYCYIVIPFKRAVKIESMALYVGADRSVIGTGNVTFEFSAFYYRDSSEVPTKIKLLTSDDTEIVEVDDGNGGKTQQEVEIEYDDRPREISTCTASITVTDTFEGFMFSKFNQFEDGKGAYVYDNYLHVAKDSFLYIRVENNSGLNRETMTPCALSFMNLIIKAL